MRNRAVCNRNRLERLLRKAREIIRQEGGEYTDHQMRRDLRASWDWLHATRETRAIVDHFLYTSEEPKLEGRKQNGVRFDAFSV
jgi:hypothetical protein